MDLNSLNAISPIDGRYWNQARELSAYFSESSLIKYRVLVEVEYFIALCEIPLAELNKAEKAKFEGLKKIYRVFSTEYASEIKETEKVTNHDVKAVEYFVKKKISEAGMDGLKEFVHFGLTSQDINNTAFPLAIKNCIEECYLPKLTEVMTAIRKVAEEWKEIPMLSRTHGQPASPTRLGKEMQVFIERLENQVHLLNQIPFTAKFGGASGNFNAHTVAYPRIDWKKFANDFVKNKLGLVRQQFTTQLNITTTCVHFLML